MQQYSGYWQKIILIQLALFVALGSGNTAVSAASAEDETHTIESPNVRSEAPTRGDMYYVDVNAEGPGDGTMAQPWVRLEQAVNAVSAGDTVWVRGGTYSEGLYVTRSGAPGRPVTFASYPGEQAVLRSRGIRIEGQRHIVIRGFKVVECMGGSNRDNKGIYVLGPGVEDIVIENNHIDHTLGSAIAVWGVPWQQDPGNYANVKNIVIRSNLIERANDGGYNEQITISNGVVDFEIAFNELRRGGNPVNGGEGIDIKEGSSNGKIHDNHIHDINRRAIYIDGGGRLEWFSPVHDIEIYNNVMHGVPNGLAIMSEGKADVHSIKIYNNLAYDVAHDCAFIFDHPEGTGRFDDIQFFNNTFADCAVIETWRKSLDLNTERARNITVKNNIFTDGWSMKDGLDVVESHNMTSEAPLFVDADDRDYRLKKGSSAINAADPDFAPDFDLNNKPRSDGAPDIGAFEFSEPNEQIPSSPTNFRIQ